jgi:hypothetical protein
MFSLRDTEAGRQVPEGIGLPFPTGVTRLAPGPALHSSPGDNPRHDTRAGPEMDLIRR